MDDPRPLLLAALLTATPVAAHQLRLFAAPDGDGIGGRVYFAGGAAAPGARLRLLDADGTPLRELTPEADGRFRIASPDRSARLLVAEIGDGHRAEWPLRDGPMAAAPTDTGTCGDADLAVKIDAAIARRLMPLREALDRAEGRRRLQDLLGGLGYIAGLAGLALWWRGRRAEGRR